MEIIFYTFNKNPNSTKQPTARGTSFDCRLIEPTSIVTPDIALVVPHNPCAFNYAYIPEFSRYYFVNDWVAANGRWVASLSVDVLASFKSYIGSSRQYVVRSSAEFDGRVVDTLYPATATPTTLTVNGYMHTGSVDVSLADAFSEGYYVVGILNDDAGGVGCVTYYEFTNAQFRSFCNILISNDAWFAGIEEISEELTKAILNPFQYIVSCMWMPINCYGTAVSELSYGWWKFPASAKRLSTVSRKISVDFNIPGHPQNARGEYMNASPFSRYTLSWPVFGTFPLPAELVSETTITCNCALDAVSGIGVLEARNADGAFLFHTSTQMGVPIQIAQMATDYVGVASNAVGAIGSLFTGNIGGAVASIGNAVDALLPQMSTKGSNGSIAVYKYNPTIECEFFNFVDDDNTRRGRPLMQDRIISGLPGFIITADAELEAPCTSNELSSIKDHLNGGFYYE